jgi:hypothetical protein
MPSHASAKSGLTAEFMASLIRWEPIPGGSRVLSRMQNITHKKLRTAFVASVGNVLVIAGYSQIELRAVAYFSGDKRMIEAFQKSRRVGQF